MERKITLALLDPDLQVTDTDDEEISISHSGEGGTPKPKRPSGVILPPPEPDIFTTKIVEPGDPEHGLLMRARRYDSLQAIANDAEFLRSAARGGRTYVRVEATGAASKASLRQSLAALPDTAELVIGFDKPDAV